MDIRNTTYQIKDYLSNLVNGPAPRLLTLTEEVEEKRTAFHEAIASENEDDIKQAALQLMRARQAERQERERKVDEFRRNTLGDFFNASRFGGTLTFLANDDRRAKDGIDQMLKNAVNSGDYEQKKAAQDFKRLLENMTTTQREEWNSNNTLTELSRIHDCMVKLLAATRELIVVTSNTTVIFE